MLIDFKQACDIFERELGASLRSPYLHPEYVHLDALREQSLKPCFFIHRENQHLFYYAFHQSQVPGHPFTDVQSPMGYGGPVSTTTAPEFLKNAWAQFTEDCRKENVLAEFVRFHPVLENEKFSDCEKILDRQVVMINLQKEDLLSTYSTRARTAVKKAQKNNLRVEWFDPETFHQIFPELYGSHMKSLGADSYYQFPPEYLRAIIFWRHSQLAVCRLEDKIVAAAIFIQGPELFEYHLSATTEEGKRLSATNLLIHEAAVRGQEKGCKVLYLGGGTNSAADNPLFFFKLSFSSETKNFSIGRRIHRQNEYNALKEDWEIRHQKKAQRILFYR